MAHIICQTHTRLVSDVLFTQSGLYATMGILCDNVAGLIYVGLWRIQRKNALSSSNKYIRPALCFY